MSNFIFFCLQCLCGSREMYYLRNVKERKTDYKPCADEKTTLFETLHGHASAAGPACDTRRPACR